MKPRALVLFTILATLLLSACPDPVREELEDEQGPEAAGVPEGPLHRAGQRCLACHREGGRSPAFSVAGTVFLREGETAAAPGVDIAIRDARGDERTFQSNAVGNFYVPKTSWSPTFPLRVELRVEGRAIAMRTEILREGACNACHRGAGDARLMPGVFVEAKTP
jgi:mono/diheme cytochrome c family protein